MKFLFKIFNALVITYISVFFPFVSCQYFSLNNYQLPEYDSVLGLTFYFAYIRDDPPPLSFNGYPIGLSQFPLNYISEFSLRGILPTNLKPSNPEILDSDFSTPAASGILNNSTSEVVDNNSRRVLRPINNLSQFLFNPDPISKINKNQNENALKKRFRNDNVHTFDHYKTYNRGLSPSFETNQNESETFLQTRIIFNNIKIFDKNNELIDNMAGNVQLTILSYDDFWTGLSLQYFQNDSELCCTRELIAEGRCVTENKILLPEDVKEFGTHIVGSKKIDNYIIKSSNMYILLLSNCQTIQKDIYISGDVYLENYFGYLPGLQVPKASLYLLLMCFYFLLVLAWVTLFIRYRNQLIHIHWAIMTVLFWGAVELIIWFTFYRHWNYNIFFNEWHQGAAIIGSVIKNVLSFMLVLVASLGWGVTKPSLDISSKRKIILIIIAYILFDSMRQIMTQFQIAQELSFLLAMSCILPVSILHGVIFFWIFTSLATLLEELRVKKQVKTLALFLRFWYVLLITMILAIVFLSAQVFSMSRIPKDRWRQDWIFTDLVPHGFFIFVIISIMYLWRPSRNSRDMAYFSELPSEESDMSHSIETKVPIGRPATVYSDIKDHTNLRTVDDQLEETSNPFPNRYGRIQMTPTVVVNNNVPQVWGKTETTAHDLDYDTD